MGVRERWLEFKDRAGRALWRAETAARVARTTGMIGTMRPAGARVVAREALAGRLSPSLLFRLHAANDPHRAALVSPAGSLGNPHERAWSFHELNDTLDRLAAGLHSEGFGRGSAAVLMLKNRPELLLLQAAIGRVGGAAVSASWRSQPPELEYIAKHSGAKLLFVDADVARIAEEALASLPEPERPKAFIVGGSHAGFRPFDELVRPGPSEYKEHSDEAAVVMYTSGTTGKPKGAVRKFPRETLAHVLAFIGETPMKTGEIHLAVCPLYHATAFGFISITYILGGTVIVLGEFRPDTFLETVERYRVTTTALVPTMLHRLLELGPERIRKYDTSSLKAIFSGGAPLSAPLARDVLDVLGDKLFNFYGATETGLVTLAGPDDLRASPGTIGRAVPGQEVRLLDDRGRVVGPGEVGELYARSEQLVAGYHADEAATRGAMRDGFFSVGDLARIDARGCFHIEGRKRDMIISGGVNVYPAEVEAAIDAHPAVLECAVIGIPDREWGEKVRAVIVLRPGAVASEEAIKAWCAARMAKPKVPREYRFVEALPRNPTGKVLKRDLRSLGD